MSWWRRLGSAARSSWTARPTPADLQAAAAEVHAQIVHIHEALTAPENDEPDGWVASLDAAFARLVAALESLDALFASAPPPDPLFGLAHFERQRAAVAFRAAARLWQDRELLDANEAFIAGKKAWNAMNDEVDRLTDLGFIHA